MIDFTKGLSVCYDGPCYSVPVLGGRYEAFVFWVGSPGNSARWWTVTIDHDGLFTEVAKRRVNCVQPNSTPGNKHVTYDKVQEAAFALLQGDHDGDVEVDGPRLAIANQHTQFQAIHKFRAPLRVEE